MNLNLTNKKTESKKQQLLKNKNHTMSTQDNKEVVVRFNKEIIEQGNAAVLKEIVADDFILPK